MQFQRKGEDKDFRSEKHCFLLTNGLGGYCSMTAAFGVSRCDQGLLIAAIKAPNERLTLVHRLRESLRIGETEMFLSGQAFADGEAPEAGQRLLEAFACGDVPCWDYECGGVRIRRTCAMACERNQTAVCYEIENRSDKPCTLQVEPMLKFAPKEQALEQKQTLVLADGEVRCGRHRLHIHTDAEVRARSERWEMLSYPEDEKDGRPGQGLAGSCCAICREIGAGEVGKLEIVFSLEADAPEADKILRESRKRTAALYDTCPVADETARTLAAAADAFIVRRDSTGGKTIVAGYPLFSDWGRDTMIALPGCCLTTGRFKDAKSILRTFLAYEKDGLVPNLFPEGGEEPMYNTVDAALLLIDAVWQYTRRSGDTAFLPEAYPVLCRIVDAYRRGTKHAIFMDADGLISAGQGLDQMTWMDVCVDGILPTPRHGKPVEINAYWYNALKIMAQMAELQGLDGSEYEILAEKVKKSFVTEFYMEDRGYLRDVLSGTEADLQLRCNQIWAVSMEYGMLSPEQEKKVVEAVGRALYTPKGLRSLSPEDPQFHPFYGGSQLQRDLSYHQGTVWVFPMGAYYRSYLKVHGFSREAAAQVRGQLRELKPMLEEGCIGQLPEIYDGLAPAEGKGCFAQAWSVGEMLRVYEMIDQIERGMMSHGRSQTR